MLLWPSVRAVRGEETWVSGFETGHPDAILTAVFWFARIRHRILELFPMRHAFCLLLLVVGLAIPLPGRTLNATTTVTSSALDSIVLSPNDRPTRVEIFTDQQFIATGYSNTGDVLGGITFSWSTDGGIGRINESGIFTGERGGIGTVTARSGNVTASVGVVVKGVRPPESKPAPKPTPESQTTVQPVVQNDEEATTDPTAASNDTGEVKGEAVESENTASPTSESCTTIKGWLWIIIIILYVILLFAYLLSLGESRSLWWWLWPLLFTAAPLVLFFALRCAGVHSWVPWTIGVLAVLISLFYLRVLRPSESIANQTKL